MNSLLALRQSNAVHCGIIGFGTSYLSSLPVEPVDPSTQGHSLQNYVKYLLHHKTEIP
jgi:hypothetical protein